MVSSVEEPGLRYFLNSGYISSLDTHEYLRLPLLTDEFFNLPQILPPRDEDKDPVEVQVEQPTEDV